jgi:hypothetical protein
MQNKQIAYVVGPPSSNATIFNVVSSFPIGQRYNTTNYNNEFLFKPSFSEFQSFIHSNFSNVTEGALWLGDTSSNPTFAYNAEFGATRALLLQNFWSQLRSGIKIEGAYQFLNSLVSVSFFSVFRKEVLITPAPQPSAGNSLEYVAVSTTPLNSDDFTGLSDW